MNDSEESQSDSSCTKCDKDIKRNQLAVQCDLCDLWFHKNCTGLSADAVKALSSAKSEGLNWNCKSCKSFAVRLDRANAVLVARVEELEKELTDKKREQEMIRKEFADPISKPKGRKFFESTETPFKTVFPASD